jgi:hypothetical protein
VIDRLASLDQRVGRIEDLLMAAPRPGLPAGRIAQLEARLDRIEAQLAELMTSEGEPADG